MREARPAGRWLARDVRAGRSCRARLRIARAWTGRLACERRPGPRAGSPTRPRRAFRAPGHRSAVARSPRDQVETPSGYRSLLLATRCPGRGRVLPAPPPRPRSRRPSERACRSTPPHRSHTTPMAGRHAGAHEDAAARARPAGRTSLEEAVRPARRPQKRHLDRCRTRPFRLPIRRPVITS
jgi:hypothetical protein